MLRNKLYELKIGLMSMCTICVMKIPSHYIRLAYLHLILGSIGKNCTICRNVEIRQPQNIFIGNNVVINKRVLLDGRGGKVQIGDNVDIAQDAFIWTLQHDYNDDFHKTCGGDVIIEDYVWVAARSNILPGTRIGKGAVVGTCSLVTKDVPRFSVVAGIPAKKIADRNSKLKYKLFYRPVFE